MPAGCVMEQNVLATRFTPLLTPLYRLPNFSMAFLASSSLMPSG